MRRRRALPPQMALSLSKPDEAVHNEKMFEPSFGLVWVCFFGCYLMLR